MEERKGRNRKGNEMKEMKEKKRNGDEGKNGRKLNGIKGVWSNVRKGSRKGKGEKHNFFQLAIDNRPYLSFI